MPKENNSYWRRPIHGPMGYTEYLLDPCAFQLWLFDHLNDIVGYSQGVFNCPISTYIKKVYRGYVRARTFRTHIETYYTWQNGKFILSDFQLPVPLIEFIKTIDNIGYQRPVIGLQAAKALRGVKRVTKYTFKSYIPPIGPVMESFSLLEREKKGEITIIGSLSNAKRNAKNSKILEKDGTQILSNNWPRVIP